MTPDGDAPAPAAPAPAPAPAAEASSLLAWAAGGAVLSGCVDLLVAVILGLAEAPSDPRVFSLRNLALPAGGLALLSFAAGAAAWRRPSRALLGVAAFHAAVAGLSWWAVDRHLGSFPPVVAAAVALHALFAALALAGTAAVKGDDAERAARKSASAAGAAAENLESILVAIVFALVIRHFSVEAYKIPTQSMAPTLLGNDSRRGPGDRVLVKKWDAMLGGPERWQIWVFRPPLNRTINYVKRAVGFGGETVEIEDGDLYVDGAVARKGPRTREDMWFPAWPVRVPGKETEFNWDGEGFRREGEDGCAVAGATERRLLRFRGQVRDSVLGSGGSNAVGDVRLRFDVEGAEPGTVFVVRIAGRGGACEARIPAEGGRIVTEVGPSGIAEFGVPKEPVRSLEVFFADLEFGVSVNGGEPSSLQGVTALPRGERPGFGVSFGVDRGGATFRNVRLDRDVFYTGTGTSRFEVPEGHVLFLGDNSGASQDARMWRGWEVRETAAGGRVFWAENRPDTRDGKVVFRDRNGVFRSFAPGEATVADDTVPMSFVPLEDLHGRAFAIFWPPRGFTKVDGGRVRVLP